MVEELKGIKWNKIDYEEAMRDIFELNDRYPGYPFPQYEDNDMVIIVSR